MKKYKNPLRRSILKGCGIFIAVLCLTLATLGFFTYYQGMVAKYQTYIGDALELCATEIDAEDLKACIESGEKSEAYLRTQDFLNRMKELYDFAFLYAVKPLNLNAVDNMMDVIAGVSSEEARELGADGGVTLGGLTGDNYSPDVARRYLERMDGPGGVSYYRNRTAFGYMYTGLLPIRTADGETVAILSADLDMTEVERTMLRYLVVVLAEIAALSAAALPVLYQWLNRRVIRPMMKLEYAANGFVRSSRGQENPDALQFENPDIRTGDELESLSDALSAMAHDMKQFMTNLLRASAEKERIGAELNLATRIQASMLPNVFPPFPDRPEFDIYASMTPAKEVGGDFYDFFFIDKERLGLVIADVSGKGVPAALFMTISKILVQNRAMTADNPADALKAVNEQICRNNPEDMFVTVWLGILNLTTGELTAANAGHEYPILKKPGGHFEVFKDRHGFVIGGMEETRYRAYSLRMEPGAKLFVYTDGVPEATNAQQELFGIERTVKALNEAEEESPQAILKRVDEAVGEFVQDAPQFDDLTMLCIHYIGPAESQA